MPAPLFVGSGVALVMPFGRDGVEESVLRELVRFHLREGTDALIVNGSTGEASTMSAAEQRHAAEVVRDEVRKGVEDEAEDELWNEAGEAIPVIVGLGGSDTAATVRLARQARAAGADGVLLSPPPYNKPTQPGIIAHFRSVLDAADLPLIVYNVPGRTACNILPATIEELARDERVVGVKEASGDISQVAELARRVGERIAIYSGNDDQIVPILALGGRGVISVLANVAPIATLHIVHQFLIGDPEPAKRSQLRYLPLIHLLFREPNPIPVKAAVQLLGFDVGDVRLPLLPASEETRDLLGKELRRLGLLPEPAG